MRTLCIVAALAQLAAGGSLTGFTVETESLGPYSGNEILFANSPDGLHCVILEPTDQGNRLFVDGKPGPEVGRVYDGGVRLGPGGKHWVAHFDVGDDSAIVVVDGEVRLAGQWVEAKWDDAVFSGDGEHYAYPEYGEGGWAVVWDGRRQPAFPDFVLRLDELAFSPDGRHLAWDHSDGEYIEQVYLDGKPGPGFYSVYGITFSDGGRLAYVGIVDGRWKVMLDGAEVRAHDEVYGGVSFLPGTRSLAYVAKDDGKWRAWVGGKPGPECGDAGELAFSADGSTWGHFGMVSDTWRLFVNGEERARMDGEDEPELLCFDETGAHYAYVRPGGYGWACFDGTSGPWEKHPVEEVYVSPRGGRWAYLSEGEGPPPARSTTRTFVIDGEPAPVFDQAVPGSFRFSPDGAHYAYVAGFEDGLGVVRDGNCEGAWDKVARRGPRFNPDGSLEFLGARAGTLYRVKYVPDAGE